MVPDYYARLGIEPGSDRSEIEAALRRLQPIWSLGTRNPKTRHTNQTYLDEIPALRRAILGDSTAREAYDAELASAKWSERQEKLDELERRVRLRAARGVLSASDRKLLLDETGRLGLPADALAPLIKPIPKLEEDSPYHEPDAFEAKAPVDILEPATRRQIRIALEHLHRRDLYDVLGVRRDAPESEIVDRADAERRRWMNKAQVTAEKTAWLEVISHAQSHLGNSKSRERYDRTLELDSEEGFENLIEFAARRRNEIDQATQNALIAEASVMGISRERAESLIERKGRQLDISVPRPMVVTRPTITTKVGDSGIIRAVGGSLSPMAGVKPQEPAAPPPKFVRCPECSGMTEIGQEPRKGTAPNGPSSPTCRHCGASLEWECPICKKTHRVDKRRCDCGFRVEYREPLARHFAAAQHAFKINDLDMAAAELQRVQEMAPLHVGARNGMVKVEERRGEIAKAKAVYERARAAEKHATALAAIEAWKKLVSPSSPEIQAAWDETVEVLKKAEALAAQARKLEHEKPADARALYRQALAISADLPEAIKGLGRTPPDPATQLTAQILGDRIRLRWTPPAPDGVGPVSYVVVRKQGGPLTHPEDGAKVAETTEPEIEDTPPVAGEVVAYAVLTRRNGVDSITGVTLAPFPFLPDVKDARIRTKGGDVVLSWSPPSQTCEIRVVRKPNSPPTNPRDGERIAAGADYAVDPIPGDGKTPYYYGIYAAYRLPDGRLYPAPGVVLSAPPPQA